jgi:ribose transport system ATP-binding protein
MKELFELADRFIVLRDGRHIASMDAASTDAKDLVVKMTGRSLEHRTSTKNKEFGPLQLQVQGLSLVDKSSKNLLDAISFNLRKGEILGVYGLLGAGRTELLETLFGLHKGVQFQKLELNGHLYTPSSPQVAINAGLALVPEDRKLQGLFLDWSLSTNISLPFLEKFEKNWGGLDIKGERKLAAESILELGIKASGTEQIAASLSGGNQQKIVLAKWLSTHPKVLLLDEPTRGVDVNAKMEIYHLIKELSSSGLSILMASSELPEILAVADTVMVMREGKVSAIMPVSEADETKLLTLALPQ